MLKLATITPKVLMPTGPIALGLAHLLDGDGRLQQRWADLDTYIILDNSAFELGSAYPIDKMITLADKIGAQEIVLPDEFRDGLKTIERTKQAIQELEEAGKLGAYKLQAVPQGETLKEWVACYEELAAQPEIEVLAINRDSAKFFGTRTMLLEYLEREGLLQEEKEYHLLGMQDNALEIFIVNKNYKWVRSVDTCFPWLVAKHNAENEKQITPSLGIDRSYFTESIDFDEACTYTQVEKLREAMKSFGTLGAEVFR